VASELLAAGAADLAPLGSSGSGVGGES